jgi:hypothetical protein
MTIAEAAIIAAKFLKIKSPVNFFFILVKNFLGWGCVRAYPP